MWGGLLGPAVDGEVGGGGWLVLSGEGWSEVVSSAVAALFVAGAVEESVGEGAAVCAGVGVVAGEAA